MIGNGTSHSKCDILAPRAFARIVPGRYPAGQRITRRKLSKKNHQNLTTLTAPNMKLHLPKQLFTALLAAISFLSPAALTLGSAAWGEETEATTTTTWAGPGYMWIGAGGDVFADVTTAAGANEIWKNSSNWQTVGSSYTGSGNGPGTASSNMWETIKIDGSAHETGVTFGSEEKRLITFEGWNPRFELSNNVKLYASMGKWQAATALTTSVTNSSTLDIDFGSGFFQDMNGGTSSLTIGESSSIIFRLQQTNSVASFTINLQDATSTMEFIGKSAITHSGAITVSSTYIAEAIKGASDSFGRIDLGLYADNVNLSNLSFDFGLDDTWLATDVEITSDNAADYGNYYNIGKSAETGRYYITYSRRDANYTPLVYSGGTLTWNGEATFDSDRTFNANDDVTFQTANADVMLGMNVDAKVVTIEDGVTLSLTGGDYTLSSDILNLRGGTLKLNDNAIAEGALKLKDGSTGTLSLGNDVALDIVDTPTGIDLSVQMGSGSELNINPTSSSLSVQMGSGAALNINSISTNHTFATEDGVTDSTVTLQSGYSQIQSQFASYKGNLVVSNGTVVYIGADKDTNDAGTANFNVGRVVIESGGAVHTHTSQAEITSDWDLRSGSTLGNKDSNKKLSGDIRFNIQEEGTYNANGTVTLMQHWRKNWEFSGLLSGQGNVELLSASLENGEAVYKLSGATNDFTGTYILKDGENAGSERKVVLQLANATAAQYATVKLSSTNSLAVLRLDQNATIKGLYSTDADNKVTTTAAATLTVSEGDFAGKLENGSATNILSLIKNGTGELELSGANTYSGGTEITGGTLTTSNSSALGSGAVTLNNGTLKLGADLSIASLTEQNNSTLTLDGHTLTVTGDLVTNGMTFGTSPAAGATVGPGGKLTVQGVLTATTSQLQFAANACSADDLSGLTLRLEGVGNEIINLDMDNNGNARGTLELAADSTTQVTTLFLRDKATISLENGATLKLLGDEKLQFKGRESGSAVNNSKATGQYSYANDGYSFENGDVTVNTASNEETLSNKLVNSSLTNTGSGVLKVNNSANSITALSAEAGNVTLNETMRVDDISAKQGKVVSIAAGKTLNMGEGSKVQLSGTDSTAAASMTAKTGSAMARLQADASFTIQDMTLTNTTITATTPTTQVNLQNVTASNVVLKQGKFSTDADMGVTVGMGGSGSSLVFEGGLAENESITIKASEGASLAVDLGDLSCVTSMGPGKYDLSITLSGVTLDAYTDLADGAGITFAGWLGELIGASSGVQVSFSEAVAEETPAAAAEGGAATGVTYSTGSVGTVINIYGLNVPEPASATLGLAALMMLCARRRRKA